MQWEVFFSHDVRESLAEGVSHIKIPRRPVREGSSTVREKETVGDQKLRPWFLVAVYSSCKKKTLKSLGKELS